MKKIIYFICFCLLVVSCANNNDDINIKNILFGVTDITNNYDSLTSSKMTSLFNDDFMNNRNNWSVSQNDNDDKWSISEGFFWILENNSTNATLASTSLNLDFTKNFQIEFSDQNGYWSNYNKKQVGLLLSVNNDFLKIVKFKNQLICSQNTNGNLSEETRFNVDSDEYEKFFTLTVRKIEKSIYLFYNKDYVGKYNLQIKEITNKFSFFVTGAAAIDYLNIYSINN